jgi:tetratricopeptide (TPR) repeat protein
MSFIGWLKSLVSKNNKALFLYKRGMAKATKGDHGAAILDYTAAIEMRGITPKVSAMAYYNRALSLHAKNDNASAIEDLHHILDMRADLPHLKKMAKQKIMRIDKLRA